MAQRNPWNHNSLSSVLLTGSYAQPGIFCIPHFPTPQTLLETFWPPRWKIQIFLDFCQPVRNGDSGTQRKYFVSYSHTDEFPNSVSCKTGNILPPVFCLSLSSAFIPSPVRHWCTQREETTKRIKYTELKAQTLFKSCIYLQAVSSLSPWSI